MCVISGGFIFFKSSFYFQKTFTLNENVHLNGYTVFFPSVCVGNAAQLAVDLIISTLEMRKIANIWHVSFSRIGYILTIN